MPPQKQRKVVVMGFRAVGKSTITVQYVENHFADTYNPTIENTFHKVIKHQGEDYQTEIVDTAGLDEFSIFPQRYCAGVHGYILVYSVTSKSSLEVVRTLNDRILNACGTEKIPRVLVGNKSDLVLERQISREEGQALANEWSCGFVECSGKHNENIAEIFKQIIIEIEKDNLHEPPPKKNDCIMM
eukprot:Phypoly_transcript_19580.p1 GENE.Phypoly_transcript_19580~~Phypoly_transcript_19580.p1  ORF type:complete len:186 (+),score=22.38 Phypoly_transcript_19580:54-611(+)